MTPLAAERIAQRLRERGFRVTAPRLAVYRAVAELPDHPDVDAIADRVRGELGRVSTQTVYDGLRVLSALGVVRRIEPAGSPARYETRVGDNHHHVVCRVCGAAQDIECAAGVAPCLDPSEAGGFSIDEAEVTFWGLCPSCRSADVGRPGATAASRRFRDPTKEDEHDLAR